jgi:hypothetical protein
VDEISATKVRWGILVSYDRTTVVPKESFRDACRAAQEAELGSPGTWAWVMRRDSGSGVWINPGTGRTARELMAGFDLVVKTMGSR